MTHSNVHIKLLVFSHILYVTKCILILFEFSFEITNIICQYIIILYSCNN